MSYGVVYLKTLGKSSLEGHYEHNRNCFHFVFMTFDHMESGLAHVACLRCLTKRPCLHYTVRNLQAIILPIISRGLLQPLAS
jgi:hypothetical protein